MKEITLENILNVLLQFKEETDNRLTSLENIVTKIEYEHSKKLDLLLDYAKGNIEKHATYDADITQINSKLFNHDIRIDVLEEKLPKAL